MSDDLLHGFFKASAHRVEVRLLLTELLGAENAHFLKFADEPRVDLLQILDLQYIVSLVDHFSDEALQLSVQLYVILKRIPGLFERHFLLLRRPVHPHLLNQYNETLQTVGEILEEFIAS